jgi:hypothetical protein
MFRKGQLNALPGVVVILAVISIIASISQTILANVQTTQEIGAYDYNTTIKGQEGIWNVAQWQPTIGMVVGAAAVVIIVMGSFGALAGKRGGEMELA